MIWSTWILDSPVGPKKSLRSGKCINNTRRQRSAVMKKRTKILLIAGFVLLLFVLSPSLMKLRCKFFLDNMNQKTAVHTVSQTHTRSYTSPSLYLDSSSESQEWFCREADVYVESVSTGGNVSYILNDRYKSIETDYQWERIPETVVGGIGYTSFWKAYTWEVLEAISVSPVSVRIADGLIQVVFHTSNTGTNYNKTELCFRFNFLLQFDSVVSKSVTYADGDYDPGRLRQESTTVRKIVSFDKDEISDKINEQYAQIREVCK